MKTFIKYPGEKAELPFWMCHATGSKLAMRNVLGGKKLFNILPEIHNIDFDIIPLTTKLQGAVTK